MNKQTVEYVFPPNGFSNNGITLRNLFIGQIIQGMCSARHFELWTPEKRGQEAIIQADAILTILSNEKP